MCVTIVYRVVCVCIVTDILVIIIGIVCTAADICTVYHHSLWYWCQWI